jgi:hypothetical protein
MQVKMRAELVVLPVEVGGMLSQTASLAASTRPFSNEQMAKQLHEDQRALHQILEGELVLQRAALLLRASQLVPERAQRRKDSTRYDFPFLVY